MSSKEMALRFVLDHPRISCAISGFSRISDVEENLAAEKLPPLSHQQRALLAESVVHLKGLAKEFCTQCRYCMPCPQEVDIPRILDLAAHSRILGMHEWAQRMYAGSEESTKADRCTQCGQCVEKCTNKLDIPEELEKAHELLS